MDIDFSIPGTGTTLGYVDLLFFLAWSGLMCVCVLFGYWNDIRK